MANLIAARNIAEGRGFVAEYVGDYIVRRDLPGPELTRPPGLPYVIAPIYRVFGVSLAAHVWLNAFVVLLSAWLLRAAIRADGGDWPADVAGLAMLQVHAPLTDAWNNGPLMLITAAMILLAVLSIRGRIAGVRLAVACAFVTAMGFFLKQTFMLSGGACAILLLASSPGRHWRQRARDCVVFALLFLLLTSPYWATNLARYGEPMYAPIHRFHLETHYGAAPWDDPFRRVMFDVQPLTLSEVVDRVGIVHMFRTELVLMRDRVAVMARPSPLLLIPAALGLLLMRRADWRTYAALGSLTVGPLADTALWFVEPRYLLPLFPCLFFLGWLAVRNYRMWAREAIRPPLDSRVALAYAGVLAGAALYAVVMAWPALQKQIIRARTQTPAWVDVVRNLPKDVMIMSDQPPAVSWWTRRHAMVKPRDDRADLLTVLRMYRPGYYLDVGTFPPLTAWSPGELEQVATGAGWTLYRIRMPASGSSSAQGS